ncbi:MAG: AmmeMemoRadiSam system protein A [Alteromonadaceae bacterium]|nr:AmmeMemoRadiSam system protein A [Alteromonadaceae bacterium]
MPVSSPIKLNSEEEKRLQSLVWQVLRSAAKSNEFVMPSPPQNPILLKNAASFVTIYVEGELRGCIGICEAVEPLWSDVCRHAFSSAMQDWRFEELQESELCKLSFSISVLSEPTPMINKGEQDLLEHLSVGIDGLILKEQQGDKRKSAVFLPSVWRSLTKPALFVKALKQKGDWSENYWSENIELFRFTSVEYYS